MLGSGYDVLNFGKGGTSATSNSGNPYISTSEYQEALKSMPDIVIFMLGTNDANKWNWKNSGAE